MQIIPPYLQAGDTIGVVCPSGFMPFERATACVNTLTSWGFTTKLGKTVGNQFHYFSGTDAERLADIQTMLDNTSVKAILFGRGGYGLSRIIDQINWEAFAQNPKWLIGFSDITVLHAHMHQTLNIATMHAPMAGAFNGDTVDQASIDSLKLALNGNATNYSTPPHDFNRIGTAKGTLIGGNLAIIAHLIGSKSAYETKGKILVIEDVGEYLYNIDRMLLQLKRSSALAQLAGCVVGGFTEMKDTTVPFGQEVYAIIENHLQEYDYPVCYDFPVSHGTANWAVKFGIEYQLEVSHQKIGLTEIR